MLDRGEVREEALRGSATGYRIADDRTALSASARGGETGQQASRLLRRAAAGTETVSGVAAPGWTRVGAGSPVCLYDR